MPALKLFGRKWLTATDDMVFPGLFEFGFRLIWEILVCMVFSRYYPSTWECEAGAEFARCYLIGIVTILAFEMFLSVLIVYTSAQGSIADTQARRHVPALLTIKILMIFPAIAWNVMGTMWIFGDTVRCSNEHFTKTVIEGLVIFNWLLFAVTIFGLALVFDPLGSVKFTEEETTVETLYHRKVTQLWMRRFHWLFWVRKDEHCKEAFQEVASLFSTLFRSTDLVPSDVMAGCVLIRVLQKRETRELTRIKLDEDDLKFSSDIWEVFADAPPWMSMDKALRYLKYSLSLYSWPFVVYRYPFTWYFRILKNLTCCSCFRRKASIVTDDNCCLCNLAGLKYISDLKQEDILYASFQNHIFEIPFCVIADHKTESIVIAMRGSMSLRDIFTDLTAASKLLDIEGLPPESMAHKGVLSGAMYVKKLLEASGILEHAFATYPKYNLILTGHSLGGAVASVLAILLRSKYPDVKVYAFAPPGGTLSYSAAKFSESFVFSIGVGDDFAMRISVEGIENLRTSILQILQACRLPKYRIMLNGFGYALFGVPSCDLDSTWKSDEVMPHPSNSSQSFSLLHSAHHSEISLYAKDLLVRRFSPTRLYTVGKILHVVRTKATKAERKRDPNIPKFKMRWASFDEFTDFRIMPRMLLDHLPENIFEVVETVINEQKVSSTVTVLS